MFFNNRFPSLRFGSAIPNQICIRPYVETIPHTGHLLDDCFLTSKMSCGIREQKRNKKQNTKENHCNMKTCNKEDSYKWTFTTAIQNHIQNCEVLWQDLFAEHSLAQQWSAKHMVSCGGSTKLGWIGLAGLDCPAKRKYQQQNRQNGAKLPANVFVRVEFSQSLVSIKTNWARHWVSFIGSLVHWQ